MPTDIPRLAPYPSGSTRKAMSPTQRADLHRTIAVSLGAVLTLPNAKRTTPHTTTFLKSFVHDVAYEYLQGIIWDGAVTDLKLSVDERAIKKRTLRLAEAIAASPGPEGAGSLDVTTLLDLALAYPTSKGVQRVFSSVSKSTPGFALSVQTELVPTLITLLEQQTPSAQGLYSLRRVSACVLAFVCAAKATPEIILSFSEPQFVRALKSAYEGGLVALAAAYGGVRLGTEAGSEPDEWEKVWVETKVALLDTLHAILGACLSDLAAASVPGNTQDRLTLTTSTERAFAAVFVLMEGPAGTSDRDRGETLTPFLDQPLLADYQQAYDLAKTLAKVLQQQREKDARFDVVEAALRSWDASCPTGQSTSGKKNPGALKIVLRSSGVQAGIDHRGKRPVPPSNPTPIALQYTTDKGKERARPSTISAPEDDEELALLATQVLDILPDTTHPYAARLLADPRFSRDPAKVIEALLDGTAPGEVELADLAHNFDDVPDSQYVSAPATTYTLADRHNVFDAVPLDMSHLRVGKAAVDTDAVLADRAARAAMKADILRRAEALAAADDEEPEMDAGNGAGSVSVGGGKGKEREREREKGTPLVADLGPEEDEGGVVRILGDGEDSGDEDGEDEDEEEEQRGGGPAAQSPESILELAYLRDTKLFDRDATTRKGKAREQLKAQTGWEHEQIEGWRVMLERNPGQIERLAEKYAFRGNEKGLEVRPGRSGGGSGRGGRARGRGGAGAGSGGGRGGGAGGGESSARERAWKDKNKASRGNHNRKRGHDKKMARAGAVAGPSQ